MSPKQKKRLLAVGLILLGVAISATLMISALGDNLEFYKSPSEIVKGDYPKNRTFRAGGMVKAGSIIKSENSLDVEFIVTDYQSDLKITHNGLLPDLFRDEQGIVAIGMIDKNGIFVADTILAKHDENYMPPEVADSLKQKKPEYNK